MQRVRKVAQAPEVVIPVGVLLAAVIALLVVLAVLHPAATVVAALVGAVVAGYATVISVILTRYFERERDANLRMQELERETRAKKVPEYEKFVAFLLGVFMAQQTGRKPMTPQQLAQGFHDWTKALMMWGSDEVVRRWGQLRLDQPVVDTEASMDRLFKLEELWIELRRDAGYPETTLRRGDLLRLFVNDIDQHLAGRG